MHHSLRGIARAILALALVVSLASPAAAASSLGKDSGDVEQSVPIVFDALLLRPIGLALTILGTVFYAVPVAPITAITRPSDLGKPFKLLVVTPARYTFADPLGQH